LLSVNEVARRLGVATATVYGLCADGRLTHVRILNLIRIAPSDLAAFVESCRDGESRHQGCLGPRAARIAAL
jgi:excisionase family DNA binding protein